MHCTVVISGISRNHVFNSECRYSIERWKNSGMNYNFFYTKLTTEQILVNLDLNTIQNKKWSQDPRMWVAGPSS